MINMSIPLTIVDFIDRYFHYRSVTTYIVGLGALGVTCSPRDPRLAGSNPAEVNRLFEDVKILSTGLPAGTLSWGPESEISGSLRGECKPYPHNVKLVNF